MSFVLFRLEPPRFRGVHGGTLRLSRFEPVWLPMIPLYIELRLACRVLLPIPISPSSVGAINDLWRTGKLVDRFILYI